MHPVRNVTNLSRQNKAATFFRKGRRIEFQYARVGTEFTGFPGWSNEKERFASLTRTE
jgi:hypothetical protein